MSSVGKLIFRRDLVSNETQASHGPVLTVAGRLTFQEKSANPLSATVA
jgi:hypothetical protein